MNLLCLKKSAISLILIIFPICIDAQTVEKKIYQTDLAVTAPEIDGLMNDSCWNQVEWSGDFIQSEPYDNKPPTQQTEFKMLYDNDNLYVYIRAYDKEVDKISRIMSRRDNLSGDQVQVIIDSYYDQQTAFAFTVNASGVKADEAGSRDGNNWDSSWNPVWYVKTSMNDKGWCAEMKIPYSQLRFGKKDEQIWGIQVRRYIYRLDELSAWQFIPKGSPGTIHLYGELHGINQISPRRQVELLPYLVAKTETFEKEAGNPFKDGSLNALNVGIDGKIAINNDLTLDLSINPDFGQVEADPSEVNLTAFETYFSEQRPLFVEGKNIYQFRPSNTIVINKFQSDNLFYSRRIGSSPHGYPSLSGGEYVDMPQSSKILGAMKLSGKTKKGLSIGILESVTANEKAEIDHGGVRREESVEPLTNYFVGRLQQDINKGETVIGGMITAVNRDIENPALDFLHTSAYTGGIDFQHNWNDRTWYVAGNMEFSNVRGSEQSIIRTQRSSARYYQRPDAGYVSLDSSRTSLSGYGGTFKLGRSSDKRIQFETSLTLRSPGLEFNDIGYMQYADMIHHGSWMAFYWRNPFSIFNNFYLNTNYWMYWNYGGELVSAHTNMNFNSQFKNRWHMNGNFTRTSKTLSSSLLRGGPSFISPGGEEFNFNFSSDDSKKVSFNVGTYQSFGDHKSFRYNEYWMGLDARPIDALLLSFQPDFMINNRKLQYVSTTAKQGDPRYLFARLDQKTFSFTLRVNYTINPELSVEYYCQPFVSAGEYTHFNKITDPRAGEFEDRYHLFSDREISYNAGNKLYSIDEDLDGVSDYSVSNPDFNFRQFRSNLVVRWEYMPGSTLYLVWSQGRTSNGSNGIFDYGSDMSDLFGRTPHNVFLLKFSYWLPF
ncbi:MAG: DUF5916 domain-containing protein [Bacteroidales bacterium]|nr:DUF5916 domain-containing protein [Bacteroidales bacterium]